MSMPNNSFGRLVRNRRTKLGLSQAKLAELVGRSTATIRSWERDTSRPTDPKVLGALAAVLGVDEDEIFTEAEVDVPASESNPTVEQALATLSPVDRGSRPPRATSARHAGPDRSVISDTRLDRELARAAVAAPAYAAPPDPLVQVPLTPAPTDVSYVEDQSQRQMYRVRNLATLVASVILVIAFIWAFGEGLGALGDWWDGFFGNLRV